MADADFSTSTPPTDAAARIVLLESALADRDTRIADLVRERDELRAAYDRLWLDVELMRRRIFIAKAERVDTKQLELEFKDKLAELDKLAGTIGLGSNGQRRRRQDRFTAPTQGSPRSAPNQDARGARRDSPIPRWTRSSPRARPSGWGASEESSKIVWATWRPTPARRLSGKVPPAPTPPTPSPEKTMIITAPMPPEMFPRSIATVSLVAHIVVDKYCDGLPLHRQENRFARLGVPIDRGTMSRWMEHARCHLWRYGRRGHAQGRDG
jgi:hypothetical protein